MQIVPGNVNRSFSAPSSLANDFPFDAYRGVGTIDDAKARLRSGSQCGCESALVQTPDHDTPDAPRVPTIPGELPEIPRVPGKKRTYHLVHADLETLVRPLLSRHWHVGHAGGVAEEGERPRVLTLNKLFTLADFSAAVAFFDALAAVQEEERHHARVTVDYAHVYVSVHTHVAYQPSSTSAEATPVKVPGLTVRDVRFAVRVERLHEQFLRDERVVTSEPVDAVNLQAWSMEQLRRRYPPEAVPHH